MNVEKTFQGWRVSDVILNQRFTMHYIGHTKRQAIARFQRDLSSQYKKQDNEVKK